MGVPGAKLFWRVHRLLRAICRRVAAGRAARCGAGRPRRCATPRPANRRRSRSRRWPPCRNLPAHSVSGRLSHRGPGNDPRQEPHRGLGSSRPHRRRRACFRTTITTCAGCAGPGRAGCLSASVRRASMKASSCRSAASSPWTQPGSTWSVRMLNVGQGFIGDNVIFVEPAGGIRAYLEPAELDQYPAVYRVDLATGESVQVQRSRDGVWSWFADSQGRGAPRHRLWRTPDPLLLPHTRGRGIAADRHAPLPSGRQHDRRGPLRPVPIAASSSPMR